MKTIALVDPFWSGHHPTYIKIYSQILLELGHQVIVLCPEPEELKKYITNRCQDSVSRFHAFELCAPVSRQFLPHLLRLKLMSVEFWHNTAKSIRFIASKLGKTPDLTFFLFFDSYVRASFISTIIDRIFPYPWIGLYFHPRILRKNLKYSFVRRSFLDPLALLKSSYCLAIALLDEGIALKLQERIRTKPVIVLPDFADESPPDTNFELVEKIYAKAADRKIVGLLGSQAKRKGLLTLLNVARQVDKGWFFVFAGYLSKDDFTDEQIAMLDEFIKAQPDNCFFHFARIPTESQFNALVKICDVLFAAYENFPHSSNILAKAAAFEKPAIASKNYCMGERVKKFNLGYVIDEGNVAQCVEILRKISSQNGGDRDLKSNFQEYRQIHSLDKLRTNLQNLLEIL